MERLYCHISVIFFLFLYIGGELYLYLQRILQNQVEIMQNSKFTLITKKVSSLIQLKSEDTLCDSNSFKFIKVYKVLWPKVFSILVKVTCELEKNCLFLKTFLDILSAAIGWSSPPTRFRWLMVKSILYPCWFSTY